MDKSSVTKLQTRYSEVREGEVITTVLRAESPLKTIKTFLVQVATSGQRTSEGIEGGGEATDHHMNTKQKVVSDQGDHHQQFTVKMTTRRSFPIYDQADHFCKK